MARVPARACWRDRNAMLDVQVDDVVLGCEDPLVLAKATIEALWRADGYNNEWRPRSPSGGQGPDLREPKFGSNTFECAVDWGTCPIYIECDGINGGPW